MLLETASLTYFLEIRNTKKLLKNYGVPEKLFKRSLFERFERWHLSKIAREAVYLKFARELRDSEKWLDSYQIVEIFFERWYY